jgi:hypothetical protein
MSHVARAASVATILPHWIHLVVLLSFATLSSPTKTGAKAETAETHQFQGQQTRAWDCLVSITCRCDDCKVEIVPLDKCVSTWITLPRGTKLH